MVGSFHVMDHMNEEGQERVVRPYLPTFYHMRSNGLCSLGAACLSYACMFLKLSDKRRSRADRQAA